MPESGCSWCSRRVPSTARALRAHLVLNRVRQEAADRDGVPPPPLDVDALTELRTREADVVLAVGTMLSVYPVASMIHVAERAGTPVVVLNGQPTELDHLADVVLLGSISEVLPLLLS